MVTRDDLTLALIRELGGDAVSSDPADLDAVAFDALGPQRGSAAPATETPRAAVRPTSPEQVAAVMRLAASLAVAVVPYGGGTGLMGGARTTAPGIVLDMRRMDRVREIDADAGWTWVEAGATFASVQRALDPHGLIVGHDPWTFSIATVGGAISTNGLGFLGGKYGSMGDQVLAVEGVLADGTLLRPRAPRPRSVGFDTDRLFIGCEGAFGVITAACVRAFPAPEARRIDGFGFASFEAGFAAILAMQRAGIVPAVLDFGDRPDASAEAELYLGFDGLREEVDALAARAAAICAEAGGRTLDREDVEEFWESRHEPAENFARRRASGARPSSPFGDELTSFDYIHVSLPASAVLRYRERALAVAAEERVRVVESGVWVRPGLLSLTFVARGDSPGDAVARMSRATNRCLRLAHEHGGSMEYCHGVGLRLAHLMEEEHGTALAVMQRMKRELDPQGLLNPGKFGLG